MFTVKNLSLGFIAFIALLIGGCTGPVVQDGQILTCTVTGTLESGVYGQIGSTYSGVTVSIVGGQEPYEVSFNGQTQTVASNMASFGSISLTGASDYVNVVDAASGYNSLTGTCSLASNQIGTSTLTVTASTYSPIVGQPVILTASSTLGTTGLTYSFAVSSGENIGVNIINNGTSSATLTSCVGGSPITILATAYEVGSSTPVASATTTLPITFQGSAIAGTTCTTGLPTGVGSTGTITLAPAPGGIATVGQPFLISALPQVSSYTNLTYFFSVQSGEIGNGIVNITQTTPGSNMATVTSYQATPVTIMVTAYEAGMATPVGYGYLAISFSGQNINPVYAGSTEPLICTLGHELPAGANPNVPYIYPIGSEVNFGIGTNTGEAVMVTAWNPGESWSGVAPVFPIPSTNMALEYNNGGQFLVSVQAVSLTRPGVFCNAGAMMYDLITVETQNLYYPFY